VLRSGLLRSKIRAVVVLFSAYVYLVARFVLWVSFLLLSLVSACGLVAACSWLVRGLFAVVSELRSARGLCAVLIADVLTDCAVFIVLAGSVHGGVAICVDVCAACFRCCFNWRCRVLSWFDARARVLLNWPRVVLCGVVCVMLFALCCAVFAGLPGSM